MTDYTYAYTVTGLTAEQAEALMGIIIRYAESHNAQVGGGYTPSSEEGDHVQTQGS